MTLSITAGDYVQILVATGDTCAAADDGNIGGDITRATEVLGSATGNVEVSGTLSSTSTRTCNWILCLSASGCVYTAKVQLTCTFESTTETTTLDAGVIAGIVIGCIVAVALSIVACAWCCKCCCFKRKVQPAQPGVVMMQPAYVLPK